MIINVLLNIHSNSVYYLPRGYWKITGRTKEARYYSGSMCSLEIKYLYFQDSDSLLAGTKIHVGFCERLREIRIEPWCATLSACIFRAKGSHCSIAAITLYLRMCVRQLKEVLLCQEALQDKRQSFVPDGYSIFFVRLLGMTMDLSSDEEDNSSMESANSGSSSSSQLQDLLAWSFMRLGRKETTRYEERLPYRSHKYARPQYERDLLSPENENEVAWLNDTDFLWKYRMPREAFTDLLQLIKDDPVFKSGYKRGRQQRPTEYQVMTMLKFLGSEGTASSNPDLRNVFNTGHGTNLLYIRRVAHALRNIWEAFLKWPDHEERDSIAAGIMEKSGLPNCIGIIDGTLFPLAFSPQTEDAPDYKGRKHLYTLSSVIVCDHQRLIGYYVAGWPGSTHDNRIARNTAMWNDPHSYY